MRYLASMGAGFLVLALLFVPQVAMADLGQILGEVQWGDDKEAVVEKLRADKLDQVRSDSRFRDNPSAMQRARQQTLDRVRAIEDSYYQLEGERTDYSMSVIGGEFTPNNDESLLRVRDDVAHRYYFFLDGEFYKLSVVYDSDHVANVGFEAFISRVQQQYGEPSSTDYDGDSLQQATWEDSEFKLRVDDHSDFFGTFTMTFSDRTRVQRLNQEGREFGGGHIDPDEGPSAVSERVQSVTGQSDSSERQSAADALIGGVGEDVRLGDDDEKEEEDDDVAEAQPDPAPAESQPQQEEPASAPSTPSAAPTADDDDDDDLVIY